MTADWQLQFRGRSRFHMLECWIDSISSPLTHGMPGCGVRDVLADGRDGEWSVHVSATDARRTAEEGVAFVCDRDAMDDHEAVSADAAARCWAAAERCAVAASVRAAPHPDLSQVLVDFFDAYTALQGCYQATSQLFTADAEGELARAIAADGTAGPDALSALTYADPSGLRSYRESVAWLELRLAAHRERWTDAERDERLARHAERFRFVGSLSDRLGDDPLDVCRQRWQRELAEPEAQIAERLHGLRATVDRSLAARERLTRRLRLGPRPRRIAGNLGVLGLRRLEIREAFSAAAHRAYGVFELVFASLAPALDATAVRQMSRDEMIAAARGAPPSPELVRARLRRGVCRVTAGTKDLVSGDGAALGADGPPVRSDRPPVRPRLSGLVVSGATGMTGRVRVLSPLDTREAQLSDSELARPGEILVAAMTYPAIVAACTRVSGIITEFGGLTCHAAVIARAVGVPCIVGVREATSALRTGDLVRMDLDTAEVVVVERLSAAEETGCGSTG